MARYFALCVLGFIVPSINGQASCGYQQQAGPASPTDGQITLLSMAGKTYASGCPGKLHVDDQTSSFNPAISGTGQLAVKFGTCNSAFNNGAEVWVDWNSVGSFTKGVGSQGSWTGATTPAGVDFTFTITVPPGTSNGNKRARIVMEEGVSPPLDPCSQFSYGSCIDFTLVVGGSSGGGGGGGDGSSGGLSGGSILLILFFVLVPVYIVAGCVYKRQKLGTTGMKESCPQNEFWFDMFPQLVKEGVNFTLTKIGIKKQTTGDYDSL